jgi:hypothetical protein
MQKPRVFVCRIIAREALDMIAGTTEMELWQDELPPNCVNPEVFHKTKIVDIPDSFARIYIQAFYGGLKWHRLQNPVNLREI